MPIEFTMAQSQYIAPETLVSRRGKARSRTGTPRQPRSLQRGIVTRGIGGFALGVLLGLAACSIQPGGTGIAENSVHEIGGGGLGGTAGENTGSANSGLSGNGGAGGLNTGNTNTGFGNTGTGNGGLFGNGGAGGLNAGNTNTGVGNGGAGNGHGSH